MNAVRQRAVSNAAWVEALRHALAHNDDQAFMTALDGLNSLQDSSVMSGVRQVASDLQAALEQFQSDSRLVDLAERQVPDARHRLAHVLKLTDDAAHRTMDLVEQSCPLIDALTREAERLSAAGVDSSLHRDNLTADMARFLGTALVNTRAVRGKLTDVLLAQGYQDLSGQIIRGVMKLVDELELALNTLVRIGNLQVLPARQEPGTSPQGHGPVVPGVAHGHTVSGQQDVDAMLSGLGM